MKLNYKHTLFSSYIGYITQALVNNFLPLLFVVLCEEFDITLAQISTLILVNFGVQIIADLFAASVIDRLGLRVGAVLAHIMSALGLASLSVLPFIMNGFLGLVISVCMSAIGSGLCEVIISPIVETLPLKRKAAHMSILHSFYSWGHVIVVLGSTLFFVLANVSNWRVLALVWAIIPAINAVLFSRVPVFELVDGKTEKIPVKSLFKNSYFIILLIIMVCAGASEICMAQWASYFAETGLGVSKTVGDLLGPCAFATLMGLSRILFARFEKKIKLRTAMIASGVLCAVCYGMAALVKDPFLSLVGCALCGLSVGIMWPGVISLGSARFKGAGGTMFALIAFAGDIGCTSGPWLTGIIAGRSGLRDGFAVMTVFPIILTIGCILLKRRNIKNVR